MANKTGMKETLQYIVDFPVLDLIIQGVTKYSQSLQIQEWKVWFGENELKLTDVKKKKH